MQPFSNFMQCYSDKFVYYQLQYYHFALSTLSQSFQVKDKEKGIPVIQTYVMFYAKLHTDSIF